MTPQDIPTGIISDAWLEHHTIASGDCPDGGLYGCFDCTAKFVATIISGMDIHAHCMSLPNFPIDKENLDNVQP